MINSFEHAKIIETVKDEDGQEYVLFDFRSAYPGKFPAFACFKIENGNYRFLCGSSTQFALKELLDKRKDTNKAYM